MPRYKRRGECLKCGWCCQNEDCEHFDKDKKTCAIYGQENRPKKCIIFPSGPPITHSKCGYYFLDSWNNNKITKEIVWR